MTTLILLLFGVCGTFFQTVNALDIESVMEGSCSEMANETTTEFIDQNFILTTPRWYLIFANKFAIYRATLHHFDENEETFASIPEYRLYYESCMIIDTPENGTGRAVVTGYEPGLQSFYNVVEVGNGVADFFPVLFNESNPRNFSRNLEGASRHYITLTDNESFIVYNSCYWGPDQMSFLTWSRTPTLPEETMQRIRDHVIGQGFDPQYFAQFRYDSCKEGVLNQPSPWATTSTTTTRPAVTTRTTTTTSRSPTTVAGATQGGKRKGRWNNLKRQ